MVRSNEIIILILIGSVFLLYVEKLNFWHEFHLVFRM